MRIIGGNLKVDGMADPFAKALFGLLTIHHVKTIDLLGAEWFRHLPGNVHVSANVTFSIDGGLYAVNAEFFCEELGDLYGATGMLSGEQKDRFFHALKKAVTEL